MVTRVVSFGLTVPFNYPGIQPRYLLYAEESLRKAERVGVVECGNEKAPERPYCST